MRLLTIIGAFLVSLGLLIALLVVADIGWTIFTHGHVGAGLLPWVLATLGLLVAGGVLLALSTRRRV